MAKDPKGPITYDQYIKSDRTFVRRVGGEYNLTSELKRLRELPRVRRGRDLHFDAGPQAYTKHYIEPKDGLGQTLHIHLEEYAPGAKSQKHGHVNEAVFYILDGIGAEEHDGIRYDWEAGDAAIVHNNCVHQHFNRSTEKPARARHEDQTDVPLHEHALPEDPRTAFEGPLHPGSCHAKSHRTRITTTNTNTNTRTNRAIRTGTEPTRACALRRVRYKGAGRVVGVFDSAHRAARASDRSALLPRPPPDVNHIRHEAVVWLNSPSSGARCTSSSVPRNSKKTRTKRGAKRV